MGLLLWLGYANGALLEKRNVIAAVYAFIFETVHKLFHDMYPQAPDLFRARARALGRPRQARVERHPIVDNV
jgi:hypothetical protein